jgi:anti-sigma regulatory factor (Ser/Thr protein kinase)
VSDLGPVNADFTKHDLARVRDLVHLEASRAGLSRAEADNLVVAVNEIAVNAVVYAGGGGSLQVERVPDGLVVEIRDGGPGLPHGLADERPPADAIGGRGLWMARRLCGRLSISSDRRGVVVRMFMPRMSPAS